MNLFSMNDNILGSKNIMKNNRTPMSSTWTMIDGTGFRPKIVLPEKRIPETISNSNNPKKSSNTARLNKVCPSLVFNIFILFRVLTVVPMLVGTKISAKNADIDTTEKVSVGSEASCDEKIK